MVLVLRDALLDALGLPESCRVDQRVPKKMLVEYGAPTTIDKRLLNDAIEEVRWVAALKPGNIAVPAYRDESHEYLEVAVLVVQVRLSHSREPQVQRLAELVHRAVPYPVILMLDGPQGVTVSLAHKRAAQNEAGKVVLDGDVHSVVVETIAPFEEAFFRALALDKQPHANLMALYQGWMDCLTAADVAQVTGQFKVSVDAATATARRSVLQEYQRLEQEAARLHAMASKEKQIAKQIDFNLAFKRAQTDLAAIQDQLKESP